MCKYYSLCSLRWTWMSKEISLDSSTNNIVTSCSKSHQLGIFQRLMEVLCSPIYSFFYINFKKKARKKHKKRYWNVCLWCSDLLWPQEKRSIEVTKCIIYQRYETIFRIWSQIDKKKKKAWDGNPKANTNRYFTLHDHKRGKKMCYVLVLVFPGITGTWTWPQAV